MWRLYRPLTSLGAFLASLLVGGVLFGLVGNCAYDEFFTSTGCTLAFDSQHLQPSDLQRLLRPSIIGLILSVLILGGLRWVAGRSYHYREALKEFDLLQPAAKLQPENLGFQVLSSGQRSDPGKRPFYPTYISRSAMDMRTNRTHDDKSWIEELGKGRSFILFAEPLGGKSRALFEIAKRMEGYAILSPAKGSVVPGDETFSRVVQGHKILLLLDNLNDYISSQTPLQEFAERLDHHAVNWVVAAACSNGPERAVIKAAEGTSLGRFYRERIYSEFELLPLSAEQKAELAHSIGEEWVQEQSEWYPTPGAITTEEPTRAMRQRFEHVLDPEQKDVLRALQLLAFAGVQPYAHSRLSAILADERLFDRTDLHLRDCLTFIAEQAFISRPGSQDPVYPEPAYLRDTVSYIEDRLPMRDFPALAAALERAEDIEGLNLLGLTWGWHLNNYEQAISCFDKAMSIEPNFIPALGNKGSALGMLERHDEAFEFFNQVSSLDPNDLIAQYNKAAALNQLEQYAEALKIINQLIDLWPDHLPENPDVWIGKALALGGLGQWEEMLGPYQRALSLRSDDPKLWHDYGLVLMRFEERREEALDVLDRSLDLGPSLPTAWELKAMLLSEMKRHNEALSTIDQAINSWPDSPDTWVIKGLVLIQSERKSEAIEWLCRAWRERNRLRDNGSFAAELLKELEYDPEDCR